MRLHPLLLLGLPLLLAACGSRPDETPPFVGVVRPSGGAVAKGQEAVVEGYAFDDTGVKSVRAGGTEVLPEAERGKKLVFFRFKVKAPRSGEVRLKITAEDAAGWKRTRSLVLTLDQAPPKIELERVEQKEGRLLVVGVARDDVEVDRVVVKYGKTYSRLNLPRGPAVRFYVEVPAEKATIIAVDAVGQRTEVVARALTKP